MFPQQSQLGSTTNCLPWQDAAQYKTWRQLPANHLFFCVEIECIKPVFSERLINVLLQRSQCEIFTVIKFSVIGIKRSRPTMNNKSQQTVVFFRGLGPFVSRRPPHESTRENLWLSGYNYLHTFNQLHIFNVKLTCYLSLDSVMKTMCMQSSTLSIRFFYWQEILRSYQYQPKTVCMYVGRGAVSASDLRSSLFATSCFVFPQATLSLLRCMN